MVRSTHYLTKHRLLPLLSHSIASKHYLNDDTALINMFNIFNTGKSGQRRRRWPNIKPPLVKRIVRGSTQHMVATVDHILFIVIFTFMSHVSKNSLLYSQSLSIYIYVTDSLHLSIYMLPTDSLIIVSGTNYISYMSLIPSRAKHTVLLYTEQFVLGTNRQQSLLPSKNACSIFGENPELLE